MPADYVNKLARMFQDIKVSEDLNQSFKEMHKHNKLALPGEEPKPSPHPGSQLFVLCQLLCNTKSLQPRAVEYQT